MEAEKSPADSEKLPISEALKVIKAETLYKSEKWWSAVALMDSFGRRQIGVYLWVNKQGAWKRQQKFVVRTLKDWEQIKQVIERYLEELH